MDDNSITWLFGIEKFFNFANEPEKKNFIRYIINIKYSEVNSKPWPLKDIISTDYKLYPDTNRSDRLNFYTNICAEGKLDTKELIHIMHSIWPEDPLFNKLSHIAESEFGDIVATIFSKSQILSKLWMAETLSKFKLNFNSILLIGGWLTHHSLFLKDISYSNLYSIDLDSSINSLVKTMNPDAYICNNAIEQCIDLSGNITFNNNIIEPDLIINTSAEHMDNTWFEKLRPGATVLIQSNNSPEFEHLNYCENFGVFLKKYPLNTVYFRGETVFPSYKRFMIYGVK